MAKKKQEQRSIVKVVYFDQDTASDYLDIVAGGSLESTEHWHEDCRNPCQRRS